MAKWTEDGLRAKIAKMIGSEIPDAVWERARGQAGYYYGDALRGHEGSVEDLATDVKSCLSMWHAGRASMSGHAAPSGRTASVTIEVRLNDDERRRRDALSAYLARRAEEDPRVIAFRDNWLNGRILDDEEARALFHARECPCTERGEAGDGPALISVPGTEGYATTWPGSALYALWGISTALAVDYGWPEDGASWFVLTGHAPRWSPASIETSITRRAFVDRRITLAFAPWVTADTVRDVYRAAQREMLGGDNRPISEKMTTLFTFVNERRPAMSWGDIVAEWGQMHPDWTYTGDGSQPRRNIRKDYERIAEHLLLAPRIARTPTTQAQRPARLRIRREQEGRSTDTSPRRPNDERLIAAKDWPKYANDWIIVESIPAS